MNPLYPAVALRARHRCEYCHAPAAVFNLPLEVEHIIPPTRGGTNELSNLALACRACNLFKSNRTLVPGKEDGLEVALFHPRLDDWDNHFQASSTGEIAGRSDLGRAMVALLRMNAPHQVAARMFWIKLGLFP